MKQFTREQFSLLEGLPGEEFVSLGLKHLQESRLNSVEALLVLLGVPRMSICGFPALREIESPDEIEHLLYQRIAEQGFDDPYGRYNSLRRELSSFLSALEGRWRREKSGTSTR